MSNTTNISIKTHEIIEKNDLNLQRKNGVLIVLVKDVRRGFLIAKKILYGCMDKNTVLFLSGGETPKLLYQDLAKEKKLEVGVVAMVDERYGSPLHPDSNERMIKESRFIDFLFSIDVPFYEILQQDRHSGNQAKPEYPESPYNIRTSADLPRMTLGKVTEDYDRIIRSLFKRFQKRIAIMGIGEDGHIAGLPAKNQKSFGDRRIKNQKYATEIRDFPGEFRERITLTFRALEKMDLLIVLVFGSAKKSALNLMFTKGSEEEVPARFYTKSEIARKTILITDQKV